MNLKTSKRKFLLIWFVLFILSLVSASQSTPVTASFSWSHWDKDIVFKIPKHGSYVKFSENYTMSSYVWDDSGFNATTIKFTDLSMGSSSVPSPWEVSVTNGNVTFTKLFVDYELTFVWSGSGSSSITFSSPEKPSKIRINGVEVSEGTKWSYDSANRKVTITDTLSTKTVTVAWIKVPFSLLQTIRSNYFIVIGLIGVGPLLLATAVIVVVVKGRELDLMALGGIVVFCVALIVATILMITILNAFIGL